MYSQKCVFFYLVCQEGDLIQVDFHNSGDEDSVAIMGPSELDKNPKDALSGSEDDLELCSGDMYIIKSVCPESSQSEAMISRLYFSVSGVSRVEIHFYNSDETHLKSAMVCELNFYFVFF